MPPTPLRLALLQGPSPSGDAAQGLAALDPALKAAAAAGAAILVAPETWLPGYNADSIATLAQPRGGPWHQALAAMCRDAQCGLLVGYAERAGEQVFNAAVAFDALGLEIAHYRKLQLYGPREAQIYTPGAAYVSFDLKGHSIGILICYDVEFAPHIVEMAALGCSAILVPTANMMPFTHVAEVTVPAMAANHGLAIAYANYCGIEGDLTYAGGSVIAGPHGEVLARAGMGPTLLITDVPFREPARLSTQARDYRVVFQRE